MDKTKSWIRTRFLFATRLHFSRVLLWISKVTSTMMTTMGKSDIVLNQTEFLPLHQKGLHCWDSASPDSQMGIGDVCFYWITCRHARSLFRIDRSDCLKFGFIISIGFRLLLAKMTKRGFLLHFYPGEPGQSSSRWGVGSFLMFVSSGWLKRPVLASNMYSNSALIKVMGSVRVAPR